MAMKRVLKAFSMSFTATSDLRKFLGKIPRLVPRLLGCSLDDSGRNCAYPLLNILPNQSRELLYHENLI